MGFEQDYEQVLRRPGWGGIVTGLKHAENSARLAPRIEKRLARALRRRDIAGLCELASLFLNTFGALVDAQRLRVSVPGSGHQDALDHFQAASQAIRHEAEVDPEIGRFAEMATEELRDCRRKPDRLNASPKEVTSNLLDRFLREYVQSVLDPALPTICSYSGETWDAIEGRLGEVVGDLRLETLIPPILEGQPDRVRAPRTPKKTVDALLGESLLPSQVGGL